MSLIVELNPVSRWSGDILVIPYLEKKVYSHAKLEGLTKKSLGFHEKLLAKLEFKGESGEVQLLSTDGKIPFDYVLYVGLGSKKKLSVEVLRKAAALQSRIAEQKKATKVYSFLASFAAEHFPANEAAQALGEGALLANYSFRKYRAKPPTPVKAVATHWILGDEKSKSSFQQGLKLAEKICAGVVFARDWVNVPSRDKPPQALAREAKKFTGIQTKIFDHRKIAAMGMEALHGVGVGSSNPPVLIEMHYRPKGRVRKRVALVGKGITFDSGGLSLKPPKGMETMKCDMAGAAAVMAVMKVLPQLDIPVEVFGYVPAAENMPDGAAQRPGDIVRAYNGKTIEVLNTDAEGRLALADAMSYLSKHREVDYIIDLATLTGAALVALGDLYTAAMGTDEKLIALLREAGDYCGEKIWPLPLEEDYKDDLKSEVADLKNIGGPYAGSIEGGLFLKNFVPEDAKWVHLDIAGPAWAGKPLAYSAKGGTGVMVRTLVRFLSQL